MVDMSISLRPRFRVGLAAAGGGISGAALLPSRWWMLVVAGPLAWRDLDL